MGGFPGTMGHRRFRRFPAPPAPGDRGQQDYWDYTFSPWHGCTHVGRPGFSGCDNCYAEVGDARLLHDTVTHWGPDAPRLMMSDQRWRQPLAWNRQAAKEGTHKLIFCGSMCDVMERRPDLDAPRHRLFRLVESTPNLIWMLFTKRPKNTQKCCRSLGSTIPDKMYGSWRRLRQWSICGALTLSSIPRQSCMA